MVKKEEVRKGIAAIIYRKERGKIKFLLLKRKKNWKGWEWVKGGSKKKESALQTLKREVMEETGILVYKIIKTLYYHSFKYQRPFIKDNIKYYGAKDKIYFVQFPDNKINISSEHSGYGWFSKKEALKKITWQDQKKIFRKVTKKL